MNIQSLTTFRKEAKKCGNSVNLFVDFDLLDYYLIIEAFLHGENVWLY